MRFPNHFIKTVLRLMTAGLNNVEFPPCALYTSVNCLLEQRRLYSKTTLPKLLGAFLQREEQRAFERGGGRNEYSYCGEAPHHPLMPTKAFTIADSGCAAVVYCTGPGRAGPTINPKWLGLVLLGEGGYMA